MSDLPTIYHIPVCPFSQRIEILLALKGRQDAVRFEMVDITRPRDPALLARTRGTTALPVLETPQGTVLKESLVILRYLDETLGPKGIRQADPLRHAIENMLIAREGPFTTAGYLYVMNRDRERKPSFEARLLELYRDLSAFFDQHSPDGTFLFDEFGLAEAVFAPIFMRFWFLEYYENFRLPETPDYARVARWRQACLDHPAARQVTREEIVKLYYDYALGAGNGALPEGRFVSSFTLWPHWKERPWPPADKYARRATDKELGLI
ncbi:MAG: glutathione S-transferase family protein [Rhizobiaceae bacterium]|nr:glutathione S-transferase family protein [Rhizobiaceae bacterium]MCV0407408.1 glutathione S-transferase family protein [Rhizobiaceae bacterium]